MSTPTLPAAAPATAPPRAAGPARPLLVLAVLTVCLIPLPFLLPPAQEAVAVRIMIFAIMGVSWNIMSGFGGMFSFGHAAYFGIGAYTSAYLLVNHGVSPWIGMAAGALLAALFGVLTGYLSFRYRLRGAYFALATFAFAEMLRLIAVNSDLVNRSVGFNVPLIEGSSWWLLQFPVGSANYYWVGLLLTAGAVAASICFLRSRTGRFVTAVRDDESAASSLGIPVMRYKLATIALSAALTAVAGVLYVQYYLFVNPDLAFGNAVSIQAIVVAVIGGVGTIWGPAIGAVVLGPLNDITATLLRNPPEYLSFLAGRSGLDVIIYALLLAVIILVLPKGLYGWIRERSRR
ncbi:branched-chain amino acid transport system permease protein [Spinactinospora alkalitolerans]|uniref:Branched-chain amino acid transport system permease protein n=1 Tax=Spinactinospora alkalitolerans TaxID=687207 RepID=A0A852TV51_9ACTN|nr:branched-chain amino acid ABC transporter permease [Spinactinospora alkalitolerans]NYE45974.1 branched-chain amino acid transport system permease protein [Spinactinospora alkalitolerans]